MKRAQQKAVKPLLVDFSRLNLVSKYSGHVNERPRVVTAGAKSSYVLCASGRVGAWGGNKFGQLGPLLPLLVDSSLCDTCRRPHIGYTTGAVCMVRAPSPLLLP